MRKPLGALLVFLCLGCARAVIPPTDEAAALLALHREVLEAHLASDVDRLLGSGYPRVDDFVMAGRGEVSFPTREQMRARLGPYLASTRFDTYRDAVPPVVRVSRDGTMGWVIAQVEASGMQRSDPDRPEEPLSFICAWIELYEKREGRWAAVGNVSSFK